MSKIVASTVTYPYQVIKSRLQQGDTLTPRLASTSTSTSHISTNTAMSIRTPMYTGTIDCIRKIWRLVCVFGRPVQSNLYVLHCVYQAHLYVYVIYLLECIV